MKGRNEHTLKNHFISILRFVKRNAMNVKPGDFQDVLDKFRNLKGVSPLQTPKNHKNYMLQVPDEDEEFAFSSKKLILFDETDRIYSPHLTEILESTAPKQIPSEKTFVFSFKGAEANPIFISDMNCTKKNDSFDIESISQKLSSLSLVDQLIVETNKMRNFSPNSKLINVFSNSSSHKKYNFWEGNNSSSSKNKSAICLKQDEHNENDAQRNLCFSNALEQNGMYDFEWDNSYAERGAKSRSKTQKLNANEIQEKMHETTTNLFRKKKSMTFTEFKDSFINEN